MVPTSQSRFAYSILVERMNERGGALALVGIGGVFCFAWCSSTSGLSYPFLVIHTFSLQCQELTSGMAIRYALGDMLWFFSFCSFPLPYVLMP